MVRSLQLSLLLLQLLPFAFFEQPALLSLLWVSFIHLSLAASTSTPGSREGNRAGQGALCSVVRNASTASILLLRLKFFCSVFEHQYAIQFKVNVSRVEEEPAQPERNGIYAVLVSSGVHIDRNCKTVTDEHHEIDSSLWCDQHASWITQPNKNNRDATQKKERKLEALFRPSAHHHQ
jgi:hypothetical protein